jgi:hypothetical protein
MGIEYKLRFNAADAGAVAAELRRLPAVREAAAPGHGFDLGSGASDRDWPQATIVVEPDGAYFCDHCGGSGRAWLGEVVALLASAFGAVTVEEL